MCRKLSAWIVVLACFGVVSGAIGTLPAAHAMVPSDDPPPPVPQIPPPIPEPLPSPEPAPAPEPLPDDPHCNCTCDTPEPSTILLGLLGAGTLGLRALRRRGS